MNKPNQQILDEAAEWFVDFREGDLDAPAQQRFSQWLRRSPEHIAAYMEVAAFWADVPNVAAKEDIDVQALIAYARAEDNIVPLAAAGRTSRRENAEPAIGSGWKRGLLAASFAIALVGLVSWAVMQRGATYRTDVGEQRSVLLKDGSTVELNSRSRLRVRFTDEGRNVELLEGQALFHVAQDPLRPFVVDSGDASVRAVGTRFDVYRRKTGTVVTVIEGRVAVGADPVFLSAGEQVVVGAKTATRPKPADIPTVTAWTQRQIVFQGSPLGEVVEEFNRYNPRQMQLLDETLQTVRVSGVFSSTEPDSLLRFLREQVHLKVAEGTESVQISRP